MLQKTNVNWERVKSAIDVTTDLHRLVISCLVYQGECLERYQEYLERITENDKEIYSLMSKEEWRLYSDAMQWNYRLCIDMLNEKIRNAAIKTAKSFQRKEVKKTLAAKYYAEEAMANRLNNWIAPKANAERGIVRREKGVIYFEDGSRWIDNGANGIAVDSADYLTDPK